MPPQALSLLGVRAGPAERPATSIAALRRIASIARSYSIRAPMEKHIYVSDVAAHEGQEVLLRGWLYGKRSSGKLHFLQIRDGTGVIQCVVSKKDVPEAVFAAAASVHQ